MSVPTNTVTIVKTVTLEPGEEFVLPPNARLVAATNVSNLASSCDIPVLEDLECYLFDFILGRELEDSDTWDLKSTDMIGFQVNNIFYPLNMQDPFDHFSLSPADPLGEFTDVIYQTTDKWKKAVPQLFLSEISPRACVNDNDGHGERLTFCFSSVPSIADDAYLILRNQWEVGANNQIYIKTKKLKDAVQTETGCTPCACSISEEIPLILT